MKKKVLLVLLALLVAAVTAPAAKAVTPLRPAPTPPDTESVLILHGAFNYPGYWWDHTDLTVAVQAHPKVDEESLAAVHQAIADWDYALRQEFGGLITLTDVTDQYTAKHKADIVLHYNPTAGGTVFGGYAICGANSCPNVIVRSDLPQPSGFTYPPQYLYYVTMHELGHALGLGHAQPLTESTDLMGYGWHWSNGIVPTLSECDLDGHRDRVRVGARRRRPISSDAAVGGLRLRTSREGQPLGCPSRPPSSSRPEASCRPHTSGRRIGCGWSRTARPRRSPRLGSEFGGRNRTPVAIGVAGEIGPHPERQFRERRKPSACRTFEGAPKRTRTSTRLSRTRPSTWRVECRMRPDRPRIWTVWTHQTIWMLPRMLPRAGWTSQGRRATDGSPAIPPAHGRCSTSKHAGRRAMMDA